MLLLPAGRSAADELLLVNEFGTQGSGPGQLTPNINDLEVAPDGNLLVANAGNVKIQTFTQGGAFVREFGASGTGPGQFSQPYGIAVRKNGNTFVVDSGNGRVEVFDATGSYMREFAVPQLFYAGAAFNPPGTILYLADSQSGNIQPVSTAGVAMGVLGSSGTGNGQFLRPLGIDVGPAGNLYVADRDNNRVTKISPTGAFITQRGGLGSGPGQMRGPLDVQIDPSVGVVVADTGNRRLEVFTRGGRLIATYDRIVGSSTPGFVPAAIAVAPTGDIFIFDRQANAPRIVHVRIGAPPPELGKTVNTSVVSGKIKVREKGDKTFHVLDETESIPVGSSVDATSGHVAISSAKKGGGKQKTVFFDGRFSVHQNKKTGLTDLKLEGGNFGSCGKGGRNHGVLARKKKKKKKRHLWGHGKGHTRTSGHNGSGTVRGTFWLTADYCNGTYFKVKEGTVVVRDFTRHRTVTLHKGEHYFAPAHR